MFTDHSNAQPSIDMASWIAMPGAKAMPIFRRIFDAPKAIRSAKVQVCGLGASELYINGNKIGNHFMDPGWTNYRKSCPYVTFDVARSLRKGANAFGVMLGNGFFNVTGGRYVKYTGSFGEPRLRLALHVVFADGSEETWRSDSSWRCHEGPITFSCVYGGEDFDARLEPGGWNTPGFDDSSWAHAEVVPSLGEEMVPQSIPPMKVMATFRPKSVAGPKPGVWVYDLGQNASGIPAIRVRGKAGSTVRITPAELLDAAGLANQRSSGGPMYYDYTLRGGEPEDWQPRFTYYGFRYLQIEGAVPEGAPNPEGKPVLLQVRGLHTRTACETVGFFECSNRLFNRIHTLVNWAMRSNMQGVLTDCPHREKLGWLEQTHLMGPSLIYDYDMEAMWRKIARDMDEAQLDDGLVPDIAPEYVVFSDGFRDSVEWGSACVLVPWQAFQWYGDVEILMRSFATMRRYVDYLGAKAKDGILDYGLGDWYDFGPNGPGYSQLTPIAFTATAFYCHDLHVVDEASKRIGAAQRYADRFEEVRTAFNKRFFKPETNQYASGSQCANAMALVFDLAPRDRREAILANIVADVRAHGNHLTAGDVGYRYLLRALADGGRSDVIWDLATQKTAPSYADQLSKGATALTEAWDANPASSQNHFMLGHIEEWFYGDLAGIGQPKEGVGFSSIVIRPQVVGDVKWVKASYKSVKGLISVDWRVSGGKLTLRVGIPPGTRATVVVPAQAPGLAPSHEVGPGEHEFTATWG
jgi:hypothetical protein